MSRDLVLGLDSSTQSLTAVVLDAATLAPVAQLAVNFDADLPHYGTKHGVLPHPDPTIVHAPPLMWVEALELLLTRLAAQVELGRVRLIAGSAQQHGSVYLGAGFTPALAGLRTDASLVDQLRGVFTRATAPVWLDSSTSEDCRALDAAVGGSERMTELTGSPACERFTGPQIRRFARTEPTAWAATTEVRLVSSFLASLLIGRPAPTDHGDASGTNLLGLEQRQWLPAATAAIASDLAQRLAPAVPSATVLGALSPAIARRFGFAPDTLALAWSGDNPCSAVGLGLGADGDGALSLGTSDTCFVLSAARPATPPGGHVFIAPTGDHLALLCFANGSLAREAVRDRFALSWDGFTAGLAATAPGNQGRLLLPWFRPEIAPRIAKAGAVPHGLSESDAPAWCRAVVEGQFLSLRLRLAGAGLKLTQLRATGGAAANPAILQIAADVLQVPVRRSRVTNTAALGAALRAAHAWRARGADPLAWGAVAAIAAEPLLAPAVQPDAATAAVYAKATVVYRALERQHGG